MRSMVFAVVGGALLAGGGVTVPSAAMADPTEEVFDLGSFDPGPVDPGVPFDEYVEDGLSEFIFGAPGELTVDASHGKSAFPVPESTLAFSSDDAFIQFMVGTFNARPEWDEEAGRWIPVVETTTFGIPYTSDSSGTGLVEVMSPVYTFLGGPDGYFLIGGKAYCTDPTRCSLDCSPPPTSSSTVVQSAGTFSSAPPAGLAAPATSLASALTSLQSSGSNFDIAVGSWVGILLPDPGFSRVYTTAIVHTEQSEGARPYEVFTCGPSRVITLPNGVMVQAPGVCSTKISNPNELSLSAEFETIYSRDYCMHGTTSVLPPRVKENVPRISFEKSFPVYLPGHFSGLKVHGTGTRPKWATFAKDHCHSSGCFKRDPCK